MEFIVSAWVNVTGRFEPYRPHHALAHVLTMRIKAIHPTHACNEAYKIGNRMACDLPGQTWPHDVRSLSVGDVLRVETPPCNDLPRGLVTWHSVEPVGFTQLDFVPSSFARLEGTSATSRT